MHVLSAVAVSGSSSAGGLSADSCPRPVTWTLTFANVDNATGNCNSMRWVSCMSTAAGPNLKTLCRCGELHNVICGLSRSCNVVSANLSNSTPCSSQAIASSSFCLARGASHVAAAATPRPEKKRLRSVSVCNAFCFRVFKFDVLNRPTIHCCRLSQILGLSQRSLPLHQHSHR